jgi:hypothetical protein
MFDSDQAQINSAWQDKNILYLHVPAQGRTPFILYVLQESPSHLPQFQQSAGATPLWSRLWS